MPYVYPSNYELNQIAPALIARMSQNRLGLQLMPTRDVQAGMIEWDQKDNFKGLQQLRGLDGPPSSVKRIGSNRFQYNPGVYGEFITIGETELTNRAGAIADITHLPIPVSDLVMEAHDELLLRELDRIEYMNWLLLTTGTFSISSASGVVFTDTFAIQTASSAVDWRTLATATPLVDLRALSLAGRGKGASFSAGAMGYMNQTTANALLGNTNPADLGGKRIPINGTGANTPLSQNDVNRIFVEQNVPQLGIYDEGYYDDNGKFNLFIPDGKVAFIGKRAQGQKIGEYIKTRNAVNPGRAPGSYSFVNDFTGDDPSGRKHVPPKIDAHRGHNGGPVIYYPGSVLLFSAW